MSQNQFKKLSARFLPILINGLRSVLNPVFSILFSYVIVSFFTKELWGEFVEYLLVFFIASLICTWGSKTYLMREFSNNPKGIRDDWQQLLIARMPICLVCIVIVSFFYEWQITAYFALLISSSFVYISFLPIIFYNRQYIMMMIIETIGFIVLISLIYLARDYLNSSLLLKIFAIHFLVKALLFSIYYRKYLVFRTINFNWNLLIFSFPFLLLALTGFLQSKVDIYAYSIFYAGKALGEYQIISGFFIFSQSIVMLLIFPYVKNIYRLSSNSLNRLKRSVAILGLFVNAFVVIIIYFALQLFKIELNIIQILWGFAIAYPCYIYTIDVFLLFKIHRERTVIMVSSFSLLINFLISIWLLNLGYDISGVLAANAIGQFISMGYYLKLRIS